MATGMVISNAMAKAMCDAAVDLVDAGDGAGYINIYSGTKPASPETAITDQDLLATLTMSDPAFGAATDANPGAKATAAAISDDTAADADGTAAWFRVFDSDDTPLWDGTIGSSGTAGVDYDMIMASTSIVAGATVEITSLVVTMPESAS